MKNRKLLLVVSLVLALTMSLGGTLAYLTDTDEAVNVMTLGNVDITQHEMKRADNIAYNAEAVDGSLVEFTDGIQLYPAYPKNNANSDYTAAETKEEGFKWGPYVYTGTAWNGLWNEAKLTGAVDKFVFVENTGDSDAYFRTLIAFECPEGVKIGEPSEDAHIMINQSGSDLYGDLNRFVDYINVKGERYALFEYVYTTALKPGQWSHPSLLQVVMTHHATNKEMELLGDTYEILVLSQAMQTVNFESMSAGEALDVAFGAVDVKNAQEWFAGVYERGGLPTTVAKNAAELKAALAKGGNVLLAADITVEDGFMITDKDVTIDLSGKTITTSEGASTNNRVFKITGSSNVTIKNGTLIAEGDKTSGAYGTIRTEGSANVTLDNVKLYNSRGNGLSIKALAGTTVTINNSTITATNGGGVEAAGGTVILNDTTINQNGAYDWCSTTIGVNSEGKAVVNSGTYTANTADTWVAYVMNSGGTLEINGGAFNGANTTGILCADRAAVVSINGGNFNSAGAILGMCNNLGTLPNPVATLMGGTFSADPRVSGLYASNLIEVADGYTATQNADGTWTVK